MYKYIIASIIILLPLLYHKKMKKYLNGPVCTFLPDLTGKIIIVTGATGSIGKQTVYKLAKLQATIILACRNQN